MSVGKREPVPLLGRVQTWGIAKHGLVRDGTITLANASTEPHAQPLPAPGIAEWTSGDVLYVKRPGWTGPQIDPAEQAALIAAGLDFRNYALISGGQRSIGNTGSPSLDGGWLQFDGSGACWRWRLTSVTGTATAAVMSFQRRRFGLFDGQAYDPATYSTPAFSLRQDDLPLVWVRQNDPVLGWTNLAVPQDQVVTPYLVSATRDGTKTLWALLVDHYPSGHDTGLGSTMIERPLGFIEVTVSGTSVTAQTIRSRAECVGAFTHPTMAIGNTLWVGVYETATETYPGVCESGRTIVHVERVGHFDVSTTYNAETMFISYELLEGFSATGGLAGQIVAMWYDAVDQLHEITLDIDHTHTVTHTPASSSVTGEIDIITDCATENGFIRTGSITWARTDDYAVAESCTWTLRDNGAARLSQTVTRTGAASVSFSFVRNADESNSGLPGLTWSHSNSLSLNGNVVETRSYGPGTAGDPPPGSAVSMRAVLGAAVKGAWTSHVDDRTVLYSLPTDCILHANRVWLDLARYSAQSIGFRIQRAATGDTQHTLGDVLTPGGVITHSASIDPGTVKRVVVSGSYEPVQQAFASSVSVDDPGVTHERVCWV